MRPRQCPLAAELNEHEQPAPLTAWAADLERRHGSRPRAQGSMLGMGQVANYVIGLVEELLGEQAVREKRFPWAVGDRSPKTGRAVALPFDAYWPSRELIGEVDEDQHRRPVDFWDKPDVRTVSGVSRGQQRRIYDKRKRDAARRQGFVMVEIPWERKPPPARRDRDSDLRRVRELLEAAGVAV